MKLLKGQVQGPREGYKVTLSTAGLVPELNALGKLGIKINLAISLNATTDEVRDRIMPVNKRYPLKVLLAECRALSP